MGRVKIRNKGTAMWGEGGLFLGKKKTSSIS